MGPPRDSEQTAGHPSLFRASSPACSSPRHGTPPSFTPDFSRHGPLPQYRGTSRGAQSAAPHLLPILLKKARWGEDGELGGRRALVRQPRVPPSPRNQPRPPPCPHLRKRQRIFILMRWPGDHMAYGHVPRPGAENARHGARAHVPPCSDQGAMQTGERCPHVCPGPFFTISPLQPSSRGYYELYQGRCLEISCGAPPR